MSSLKRKILIDYDEYLMLKKKAELFEKKSDGVSHQQFGGAPLAQIVASNEFNEGLLRPSNSQTSREHIL